MLFHGTPDLHTGRLLLRKITLEDAKEIFEYASDPDVSRYVTWDTHRKMDDSLAFIQFTLQRYEQDEAGDWGIILKENGKLIGTCGYVWVDKKHRCGHIGYVLSRHYWNQGITTEAVQRVLDFGFNEMNLHRIEAAHMLPNEASGRVMQKSGLQYEGILKGRLFANNQFQDLKLYAVTKEDRSKPGGKND